MLSGLSVLEAYTLLSENDRVSCLHETLKLKVSKCHLAIREQLGGEGLMHE